MNWNRKIIYGILIIIAFTACHSNLKNNIIDKIHQECGNQAKPNCKISLTEVTKFNWNKMYIFGDWTTSDTIAKVIGFKYAGDDVPDQYWRMLFTDGTKVVYEEDNESLDYYNSSIEFQGAADSLYKGKLYYLVPINNLISKGK
jgi:hypothetical protein